MSRKRRHWATQQKAEINKLELGNQLRRTWQNLLLEYFEEAMKNTLVSVAIDGKPFRQNGRTADVCMELGGNRAGGVELTR